MDERREGWMKERRMDERRRRMDERRRRMDEGGKDE